MRLTLPIYTSRLMLRDFVVSDFDAIHAYGSDDAVTRFMFYGPRTTADTQSYLDRMLASQREMPRLLWELGVVIAAEDRLVGACDLTMSNTTEADLGFVFARAAWGRGYATEAAQALVRAGFEQPDVNRIFATCDIENVASARVLEKAGLRRAATLEHHKYARGRWWTSFLYELQRAEWHRSRTANTSAT